MGRRNVWADLVPASAPTAAGERRAADIGALVLKNLDAGREKANRAKKAHGAYTRQLVIELAAADLQKGHPDRGRGKRIALSLNGRIGESQARKILRTLSSRRDSSASNGGSNPKEDP